MKYINTGEICHINILGNRRIQNCYSEFVFQKFYSWEIFLSEIINKELYDKEFIYVIDTVRQFVPDQQVH